MEKQLETELKELAATILNTDAQPDLMLLKQQAAALYEHLCVLAYARNNLSNKNTLTTAETSVSEALEQTDPEINENAFIPVEEPEIPNKTPENLPKTDNTDLKTGTETIVPNTNTPDLLFELEELTAGFEHMPEFERATPLEPEKTVTNVTNTVDKPKASLNQSLKKGIHIGLNDRLAFVKHLFDNNQGDYTRVISQLNTLENSDEASTFIAQMVKPEYNNWEGKEAFEERFVNAVFAKFSDYEL